METYMRDAFVELYRDDGLNVLGHGLGMSYLFCKFLQCYMLQSTTLPKPLVLCINATEYVPLIHEILRSNGIAEESLPEVINNEINAQERNEMYTIGGCYFITSRILIVDLLDSKLDASKVQGVLIYNAHRISETSLDSFILRIYRERNRTGFIKAYCDEVELLSNQYMKVERLLRSLYLTRLYLWPRFRLEISQALEQAPQSNVIELSIPITRHMLGIQNAILVAMSTCIAELKKACPTLETSHWTLENGLFHHFDNSIRAQLDPEWHRIAFRTKQIVADLTVLRKLLDYLVRYDAFSFYYLLMKLHAASKEQSFPSLWLTTAAAEQIYKHAKARVYSLLPATAKHKWQQILGVQKIVKETMETLKLKQVLEPVLECPPKYNVLLEIVKEIKEEFLSTNSNSNNQSDSNEKADSRNNDSRTGQINDSDINTSSSIPKHAVLLIVRDELTLTQLQDLLLNGQDSVLDSRFRWFVSQEIITIRRKIRSNSLHNNATRLKTSHCANKQNVEEFEQNNAVLDEQSVLKDLMAADEEEPSSAKEGYLSSGYTVEQIKMLSEEQQLLLLQYNILHHTPRYTPLNDGARRGKKRKAGGVETKMKDNQHSTYRLHNKNRTNINSSSNHNVDTASANNNGQDKNRKYQTLLFDLSYNASNNSSSSSGYVVMNKHTYHTIFRPASIPSTNEENDEDEETADESPPSAIDSPLELVIITHQQLKSESIALLRKVAPKSIVMYDADVEMVRCIEVYQSTLDYAMKVYFLVYENSTEEHRYAGNLAKEKKAFEQLIALKEHLVISLPDHPHDLKESLQDTLLPVDTRKKQSAHSTMSNKIAIVDVREFRSILPSLLYTSMYYSQLLPRTLYVGDYILGKEICVERKSVPDLFQSFNTGRLYNQCEAMMRYYKLPCVLIEFTMDKAFGLVAPHEITADIQSSSIISKLVLLLQSFPQLKLLWSRSPQSSVEIFRSISLLHDAADLSKAMTAGAVLYSGKEQGESFEDWADSKGSGREKRAGKGAGSGGSGGEYEEESRLAARDLLLSLPGINVHNFRVVMEKVESVAELVKMKEEELAPLIGSVNARKLASFCKQRLV